MRFIGTTTALIFLPLIGGCTFFNVLFFQTDNNSFQRRGSQATLLVFHADENGCPSSKPEYIAAVPIFAALGQVVVNVAASEIESYIEAKRKEFDYTYKASVNLDGLYEVKLKRASGEKPWSIIDTEPINKARCITIKRTFEESQSSVFTAEEVKMLNLAFMWGGQLQESKSGTAFKFRTDRIILRRAGARTDSDTRKVDVTVQLKIEAITTNEKGDFSSTAVADKVLSFPGLTTPEQGKPTSPRVFSVGQTGSGSDSTGESSWFPKIAFSQKDIEKCTSKLGRSVLETKCPVTPVTISVLVTEAGSGSSDFGKLIKEIDDNKQTLSDSLGKALSEGINNKASSGSGSGN